MATGCGWVWIVPCGIPPPGCCVYGPVIGANDDGYWVPANDWVGDWPFITAIWKYIIK